MNSGPWIYRITSLEKSKRTPVRGTSERVRKLLVDFDIGVSPITSARLAQGIMWRHWRQDDRE